MNLKRLEISNFGSFGPKNVVDFSTYPDNDRILVIGENRDSAGSDSNGSGKSTLFNAISWAVFGKLPNGIEVEDVIRRGSSEAVVNLLLTTDDNELTIIRRRTRKTQTLSFFINGDDKTLRTTQQTQLALLQYFGILENNKSYFTDFLNTTYFSVAAIKAFAGKESSPKDRLDLIGRFLNLELLDRCLNRSKVYAQHIKTKLTTKRGQLDYLEDKINNDPDSRELTQDLSNLKELIYQLEIKNKELNIDLKQAKEKQQVTIDLKDLRSQIDRLNSDSKDYLSILNQQLDDYNHGLKVREQLVQDIENAELLLSDKSLSDLNNKKEKMEEHLLNGREKQTRLQTECGQVEKKIFFYQSQMDHSSKCTNCGHELMIVQNKIKDLNRVELEREIKAYHSKLAGITQKYAEIKSKLTSFEKNVLDINKEVEQLIKAEENLKSLRLDLKEKEKLPNLIKEVKEKILKKEQLDSEYLRTLDSKKIKLELRLAKYSNVDEELIEGYEENIADNKIKIQKYRDEVSRNETILVQIKTDKNKFDKLKKEESALLGELQNYQFWIEGFPQIRTWMIESFLPSFEEQVNTYLNHMEVGMRVRFQTFKEKKSKNKKGDKYKYQFNIEIIDENNNKRSIETYSAGESKRIGIAVGFALRELTLTRGYNTFEFLLLDEVVDSLDETGILEFFELLNVISGLKFVISHNSSLKTRFSKVIKVIKENGESTVAQIS